MTTLTGDLTDFIKMLSLEQLETSLSKLETDYQLFRYVEQDSDSGQTRLVRQPLPNWLPEVELMWHMLNAAIDWYRSHMLKQQTLFDLPEPGRLVGQLVLIDLQPELTPMEKLLMEVAV
jgi:hypothetical protein